MLASVLRPAWPADPQKGPFPEVLPDHSSPPDPLRRFRLERELPGWDLHPRHLVRPRKVHNGTRLSTACSAHITQTWRGKPLTSLPVVVELISATTTKTGPQVHCEL